MKWLFIILLLLLPVFVSAKDFSILRFRISDNIQSDCLIVAYGCIHYDTNTIFINSKIENSEMLKFVLTHEIGHFLLHGLNLNQDKEEELANMFYEFLWYPFMLTNQEKQLFFNLIKD